ncbi:MAG: DUF5989 family protein [Planctomycetota bacterium]
MPRTDDKRSDDKRPDDKSPNDKRPEEQHRDQPSRDAERRDDEQQNEQRNEFERAGEEAPLSIIGEFWLFITENKKWWLIPLLLAFLLVGLLVVLGSTGAAPFIYTLF